jgi:hypothetical protein
MGNLLDEVDCSMFPRGKSPRYLLDMRLVWSRRRSGWNDAVSVPEGHKRNLANNTVGAKLTMGIRNLF